MEILKIYTIFPVCCLILYLFLTLFNGYNAYDFPAFYYAGKYIFINPEIIYTDIINPGYFYFPSFAILISPLSLLPLSIAKFIFLFISFFFAILSIYTFNQILILKKVKNIYIRFLFLLILSNGYIIIRTFEMGQPKFIMSFLILYFIKREIKIRDSIEERPSLKFLFIQYSILIFIIGTIPSFIFILIIYIFNNINYKDIFSKEQLKKYGLVFIVFLYQNFIFLINPKLIINFLNWGSQIGLLSESSLPMMIVFSFSIEFISDMALKIFSIIAMTIISSLLIFNKKLELEEKIGIFAFSSLLLNVFTRNNLFVFIAPLIAILFIIDVNVQENFFKFIKENLFFLFVLTALTLLYFIPDNEFIYKHVPILKEIIPLVVLNLKYGVIYIFLAIILLWFYRNKKK
ncbi:MAG: hypothetical protein ACTSSM_10675 [Promethearchaeota archaeon]